MKFTLGFFALVIGFSLIVTFAIYKETSNILLTASIAVGSLGIVVYFAKIYALIRKDKKALAKLQLHHSYSSHSINERQILMSEIAHELKTPLSGVIGLLNLLQRQKVHDDEYNEKFSLACKTANNMLLLLNDNIDNMRVDYEKIVLHPVQTNLIQMIEDVAYLHALNADQKGLQFNFQLDPELLGIDVEIDRIRLQQVLNNLLTNAIKFTSEGHVTLSVGLRKIEDDTLVFKCLLIDSGMGISSDHIDQLFHPFVSEDAKAHGIGLGLSISKRILESMGTTISIKSRVGLGSQFSFSISVPLINRVSLQKAKPDKSVLLLSDRNASIELIANYFTLIGTNCQISNDPELCLKQDFNMYFIASSLIEKNVSHLHKLASKKSREQLIILKKYSDHYSIPTPLLSRIQVMYMPVFPSNLQTLSKEAGLFDLLIDKPNDKALSAIPGQVNLKVLLVEDNEINVIVVTEQLRLIGFSSVETAANGMEALSMINKNHYDLVLMDFNMPVMDGILATSKLRQMGFTFPILGLTAQSFKEALAEGRRAGMNHVFTKPINDVEFIDIVKKHYPDCYANMH